MRVLSTMLLVLCLLLPAPAQAQGGQNPYTLPQVLSLLEGGWSGSEIVALIRDDCISFRLSGDVDNRLREAGGDAALLSGLRSLCYRAPPASPRQPPARQAARGIVTIEGELPAGWFRIVNELPMSTNRTIELTPGRTARIMVSAPGWCADRTEITLGAGEEHRWTPELRARSWVRGCLATAPVRTEAEVTPPAAPGAR